MTYTTNEDKGQAYNRIAVISQFTLGLYHQAHPHIREKNDYAPLEKKLLASYGYTCQDSDTPIQYVYTNNNVQMGTLLCYESTSIEERAAFKNNTDLMCIPENNKDTAYFSSIIHSLVRDLYIYVAQSNNSEYGDSRITGPFSTTLMDIVKVKGGDNTEILVGTVNINELRQQKQNKIINLMDEVSDILDLYNNNATDEDFKPYFSGTHDKYKHPSART